MALRRKRNKTDGRAMSIWFSADVLRRLDLLADQMKESRSALVNELLEERLSYYEEMIAEADRREAEERNKAMHPEIRNTAGVDPHDTLFRRDYE